MSTKSELKENVLASKLEVLAPWFIAHRFHALTGAGIVLGMGLIASVFIIRKNETRDVNWTRLAQAQILFGQKRADAANPILTQIKNSNPGSTESLFATFYLGESALDEKKYDEAIQNFSAVVAQGGDQPLRPIALSNLGFAQEQKENYAAAAQSYQQFMSQYSEHFLAARVQLCWGKALLRAGDKEGAKKALGQLVDLYPTSPWAQNARRIMDKLETR